MHAYEDRTEERDRGIANPLQVWPDVSDNCLLPSIWVFQLGDYDHDTDMTIKWLCMNLHFFRGLVSAMNIILGHYNLIILLELMV